MLSQVIFFAALVLLIVLLLRRASRIPELKNQLTRTFQSTGNRLRSVHWSLPKMALLKGPVHKPTPSGNVFDHQQHEGVNTHFWSEDVPEEKPELTSHLEEGEELFKEGKYKEAEQFFLRMATLRPNEPKIYARLGLIYLNLKNYSDAIESLKVATKLDQYNPSRHYNLALAYMGNKDVQRAISSVREAISLDPVTPKYRTLLEQLLNGK